MAKYIDKTAVKAEIKRLAEVGRNNASGFDEYRKEKAVWLQQADVCDRILSFLDTLEVKEVNITKMADEYYDALMKETDWMDVDTMGHCRLAYYNGCKDVLNKIQKGE